MKNVPATRTGTSGQQQRLKRDWRNLKTARWRHSAQQWKWKWRSSKHGSKHVAITKSPVILLLNKWPNIRSTAWPHRSTIALCLLIVKADSHATRARLLIISGESAALNARHIGGHERRRPHDILSTHAKCSWQQMSVVSYRTSRICFTQQFCDLSIEISVKRERSTLFAQSSTHHKCHQHGNNSTGLCWIAIDNCLGLSFGSDESPNHQAELTAWIEHTFMCERTFLCPSDVIFTSTQRSKWWNIRYRCRRHQSESQLFSWLLTAFTF